MEEIWKDIYYIDSITHETVDYRGIYQVSNYGRIKNIKYNRILQGTKYGKYGHIRIYLYKPNCNRKRYLIHRLVAHMFLLNPLNKPQVDHIDTNPTNNHVDNLRWVTCKENNNNPLSIKKKSGINSVLYGKKGLESQHSIAIIGVDINTDEIVRYDALRSAIIDGFTHSTISRCCRCKYGKDKNIYKNKRWYYETDYLNMVTMSEASESQ
jgi:hypothetical protein